MNGSNTGIKQDVDLDIESGQYWLSFHGGPLGVGTMRATGYQLEGEVTTPEPATMLLMGGGLAGAFWRRRKNLKS